MLKLLPEFPGYHLKIYVKKSVTNKIIYEYLINNKYKCYSNLLKVNNKTAIRFCKKLHIVQIRHIVLCKKERFYCICIYHCTFCYNHILLTSSWHASDASGRSLYKGTNIIPYFSQPQFTRSIRQGLYENLYDVTIYQGQPPRICKNNSLPVYFNAWILF